MTETSRDTLGNLAAVALGLVAFLLVAGWWVLIPDNIAWLVTGDRAMHQLGWMFYRDAPWGLPPGASPHLGLELSSSIALVDGLPLLAIPFKLIGPLLPRPFQYWGDWWLACFVLQSVFGYRLARELGASRIAAIVAGGFAVMAPAFLFRLPLHMALAGHWTVLAALYLYARRVPARARMWLLLIGVTAAVHAYLFVMVAGIWLASYLQRLWMRQMGLRHALLEPLAVVLVAATVLWAVGFLYPGSFASAGYGYYRLNLLGPLITYRDWSRLVPGLPHSDYDYEGLSFLGIGVFGALVLAIVSGSIRDIAHLVRRRWLLLTLFCVGCCIFALSNVIGIGDRETAPIPYGPVETLGAIFRSSGRFVWPMLYLVIIGLVVVSVRRLPRLIAGIALAILLAVQVYDSSPGWSFFRSTMPQPAATWPTPLVSPFWDRVVAAGYKQVRGLPPVSRNAGLPRHPDWRWLEYFAAAHGLALDTVQLGRFDPVAAQRLVDRTNAILDGGATEPNTIYILDAWSAATIAPHIKLADLFALVDNRIVYIAAGAHLVDGLGIDPHSAMSARPWTPPSYWGMSAA